MPYEDQYRVVVSDCYGWADFWGNALAEHGYEAWEPIGNAEAMQKAWARTHDVDYDERTWLFDIAASQVRYFAPDILFLNDYATYTAAFIDRLRAENPSIRLVIGWCGAPYVDGRVFDRYDVVLSNVPALVDRFRRNGHHSELVHHAFEPRVLQRIGGTSQDSPIPFSFVGSIAKGSGFHANRERLLRHLLAQTDLQVWSNVEQAPLAEALRSRIRQGAYRIVRNIKRFPGTKALLKIPKITAYARLKSAPLSKRCVDPAIARRAHPAIFGLEMYRKLKTSHIVLNAHIDISAHHASNMRLFEATGVGACLITEHQDNLSQFFEPDFEVVTYKGPGELVEKLGYLRSNPVTRRAIARAGQRRTLTAHTFALRAEELDALMRRAL